MTVFRICRHTGIFCFTPCHLCIYMSNVHLQSLEYPSGTVSFLDAGEIEPCSDYPRTRCGVKNTRTGRYSGFICEPSHFCSSLFTEIPIRLWFSISFSLCPWPVGIDSDRGTMTYLYYFLFGGLPLLGRLQIVFATFTVLQADEAHDGTDISATKTYATTPIRSVKWSATPLLRGTMVEVLTYLVLVIGIFVTF